MSISRDSNDFDALIIIMQGLKRKRRCEDDCKDHLFSLQCFKPNPKYDIRLFFCPKYQRDPQPPEFIHPEFNNDGKYYTSAFILGIDRRLLVKNEQQQIMDHQKQLRDSLEKRNQLVFPRPNSKHTLCSVCKEHYRNYYAHIAAEEHRLKISASSYNQHIKDLCSSYEYLWEGAEERADEEAERKQAEYEEERRRREAEMIQEQDEDGEDDEEESLQDVQRGQIDDIEQAEDEEEPEEYQIKEKKPSSRHLNRNDDTLPLSRACKRSAPTEYLRNKYKAVVTAERIHKQKAERRYERERDKIKIERDINPNRQFIKTPEQPGDTFFIFKATFNNNPQIQPTPQTPTQLQPQTPQEPEFVWKKIEKVPRKDEEITQKMEKMERSIYWLAQKPEKQQKYQKMIDRHEMGDPDGSPERIQRENRKYEINYDQFQFNKDDFHEQQYDMRYPYYYPPPPMMYPPLSYKQEGIKSEYGYPSMKTEPEKLDKQTFRHETKNSEPKFQGKTEYGYKNHYQRAHSPYYPPYPYPAYDYPREKGQDFYYKEKEKGLTPHDKKHYQYQETPYQWPYAPPPPYYMPSEQPPQNYHSAKPASSSLGLQGNTNINISFPMYMCPPSHPTYPPSSRYSPPPHMMNPYMGYPYPPYMPSQQPRDSLLPQSQNSANYPHSYPQHPMHQYDMKGPHGFQPQSQSHPSLPLPQQSHQYPHSQSKSPNC